MGNKIVVNGRVFERKYRKADKTQQKFSDRQYLELWLRDFSDYQIAGFLGVKTKACWNRRLAFDLKANRPFKLDSKARKLTVEILKLEHLDWQKRTVNPKSKLGENSSLNLARMQKKFYFVQRARVGFS